MSKVWIGAAAAGVALAAVAALGWQVRAQLGGARTIRSAEAAAGLRSQGPAPREQGPATAGPGATHDVKVGPGEATWESASDPAPRIGPLAAGRTFDFGPPSTAERAADALLNAESAVRAVADAMLGPAGVPAVQRLGLVKSWLALLEPIVRGDEEAFIHAAAQLGALVSTAAAPHEPDEPASEPAQADAPARALYSRLHGLIGGASIATAAPGLTLLQDAALARVPRMPSLDGVDGAPAGAARRPGPALPMMVEHLQLDQGQGPFEVRLIVVPLQELFPDAAALASEGAAVAEVFSACRLPGVEGDNPDAGLSAYFVWNPRAAAWQPVGLRIELVSDAANQRLAELAAARARQNGGAQ